MFHCLANPDTIGASIEVIGEMCMPFIYILLHVFHYSCMSTTTIIGTTTTSVVHSIKRYQKPLQSKVFVIEDLTINPFIFKE